MEHTEIFWSLFTVDMDDSLEVQPNDTWDSFLLFQMLNNYLRMECKYNLESTVEPLISGHHRGKG